jgi:hypothetical protein
MSWPTKIENLRKYVEWECKDIPPDLILGIIKHESGGNPGILARVKCKCGLMPTASGDQVQVCNAMGLMQVIPATVDYYNQDAAPKDVATFEDMTGNDERAIRLQIRTGCKFLAFANHYLHQHFPSTVPESSLAHASDDQIALALTAYAVGNGATAKKMQAALDQNVAPTFKNLKRLFPDWGKNAQGQWINRPLKYGSDVISMFKANRSGSYTGSRAGDLVARATNTIKDNKGGVLALALCLTAAGWAVNHYYSARRGDQ